MFVCGAVHVCVTICWSGSWVSTDCTFRPIYMLSGADHSFLWRGGGGSMVVLDNMPPKTIWGRWDSQRRLMTFREIT